MKAKLLFYLFSILSSLTLFFVLSPETVSAQPYTALCHYQGGTCVLTRTCPEGFRLADPNFCNDPTGSSCQQFDLIGDCVAITPSPGMQNCPSSHPVCSSLSGSLCTNAGGISFPAGCSLAGSQVGHCCIGQDPDPNCGGHLQECCGAVPDEYCDSGYTCNSIPGSVPVCCLPNDPDCTAGVPLPTSGPSRPTGQEICSAGGGSGIDTAIGCIPVESTQAFAEFILRWGMGIAGGIAVLLIIYAGFIIISSSGNPQRLQAGKELLTSAVVGLMLFIFGAYLLQLIGVEILAIPGFGQ